MKILTGSLLFTTAILINFSELNCLPEPSGAGPFYPNFHTGEGSHQQSFDQREVSTMGAGPFHPNFYIGQGPQQQLYNQRTASTMGAGPSQPNFYAGQSSHQKLFDLPTATTMFLHHYIDVGLKLKSKKYVPVSCTVRDFLDRTPTVHSRSGINFVTRAIFVRAFECRIKIVVYYTEDESKNQILLGAKLPPKRSDDYPKGDPRWLDPDDSKWFVTYQKKDYKLMIEPVSGDFEDFRPNKSTYTRVDEAYRRQHPDVTAAYVPFCGLHLLIFRKDGRVISSALDKYWMYRKGQPLEEYAHTVPDLIH